MPNDKSRLNSGKMKNLGRKEKTGADKQIDILAKYIMENHPVEIGKGDRVHGESAVEVIIRMEEERRERERKRIQRLRKKLEDQKKEAEIEKKKEDEALKINENCSLRDTALIIQEKYKMKISHGAILYWKKDKEKFLKQKSIKEPQQEPKENRIEPEQITVKQKTPGQSTAQQSTSHWTTAPCIGCHCDNPDRCDRLTEWVNTGTFIKKDTIIKPIGKPEGNLDVPVIASQKEAKILF